MKIQRNPPLRILPLIRIYFTVLSEYTKSADPNFDVQKLWGTIARPYLIFLSFIQEEGCKDVHSKQMNVLLLGRKLKSESK